MKKYQIVLLTAVLFFIIGFESHLLYEDNSPILTSKVEEPKLAQKVKTTLQKILDKKRLDVIILNSSTVYYEGSEKTLGFEYELISSYADSIGVDLNLSVVHTTKEALQLSKRGIGDITVSGTTITQEREQVFDFGPRYYTVQEQLVCNSKLHREKKFPKNDEDLIGLKIAVAKGTSYETTIKRLAKEIDGLKFTLTEDKSTEELLVLVSKRELDCTIADSNIFRINQRYYPTLSSSLVLSDRKNLAWILRHGDGTLNSSLYRWLNNFDRSGSMNELKDFYFSYVGIFDYYDTTVFYKRLKTRLPKYKKTFQEAAKEYDIPWLLLAAQSYQESHWNPNAKSYTGVRGIMMITLTTAKQLGVKNRMNPTQSIFGGAKYLRKLEKRFSDKIKGKSRWAFTLAAYNVGMGHMHDAQVLARKLNMNPYLWSDISKILPLLSQKKYYKKARYGYARGDEPVRYVNAILHYLDIIHKSESK